MACTLLVLTAGVIVSDPSVGYLHHDANNSLTHRLAQPWTAQIWLATTMDTLILRTTAVTSQPRIWTGGVRWVSGLKGSTLNPVRLHAKVLSD